MARKLCLIATMLYLGIVAGKFTLILAIILGTALLLYGLIKQKHIILLCVLFCVFLSGSLYVTVYEGINLLKTQPYVERFNLYTARVITTPTVSDETASAYVRTDFGKIKLYTDFTDLSYGDVIMFDSTLSRPDTASDETDFDNASYLKARRVFLEGQAEHVKVLYSDVRLYRPLDLANTIRQKLLTSVDKHFSGDTKMLLCAVLLGDRSEMSDDMRTTLSGSGISHIASVSGLHVSIIMTLILSLLYPFLGKQQRYARLLALPVILLFVVITGMSPSTVRAGIMIGLFVIASVFFFDYDGLTSLSFAAIVLLLANPFCAFDAGFILSFFATLGILLFYAPINARLLFIRPKFIRSVICTTLCAQIFTIVPVMYFYKNIVLCGLVTNLVAVPLLPFIMALGFITIFVPFISPVTGFLCDIFCRLIIYVANTVSKLSFSVLYINQKQIIFLIIIYICVLSLLILYFLTKHRRAILPLCHIACAVLCIMLIVCAIPPKGAIIHFIDIGYGDCTVIQHNNTVVMIDCASAITDDTRNPFTDSVHPYLRYKGFDTIDAFFLTQYTHEYLKNAASVIESGCIKNLFLSYTDTDNPDFQKLVQTAINNDVLIHILNKDSKIEIADLTFSSLSDTALVNHDEASVLKCTIYDKSIIFTGNISAYATDTLTDDPHLLCSILKISTQNDNYLTTGKLLGKIKPTDALICADDFLPNEKDLSDNSFLYTTHNCGTVRITLPQGDSIQILPYKGANK